MNFIKIIFRPRHWSALHFGLAGSVVSGGAYNLIVIGLILVLVRGAILDLHKSSIQSNVQTVASQASALASAAKQGYIPEEEAKRQATEMIRAARYGEGDYYWIHSKDLKMIMHPVRPELEGNDLSQSKDPNGKLLFAEMNKGVASSPAGAFVEYQWPKPGEKKPVPKMSFVKEIPEWGWIVGSGIYIDHINNTIWHILSWLIGAAIVVGAASVIPPIIAARFSARRINVIMDVCSRIGTGDLTARSPLHDMQNIFGKLSTCINEQMAGSLSNVIVEVKQEARTLSVSSGNLGGLSKKTAQSNQIATMQAADVATATEEMAATSHSIAENCLAAVSSADTANANALEGSRVIQSTAAGMHTIAEEIKRAATIIDSLGLRSDQIGEITGTIEDIADQTNLLALNAAIEAARAGEQGRGFAVVADEVRALAERTTKATKEISDMIKAIQGDTKNAVLAMESSVSETEKGSESARLSGEAINSIIDSISNVSAQINQIATAAEEQSAVSHDIANSVNTIREFLEANQEDVKSVTDVAAQLADVAGRLTHLTDRFQVPATSATPAFGGYSLQTLPQAA